MKTMAFVLLLALITSNAVWYVNADTLSQQSKLDNNWINELEAYLTGKQTVYRLVRQQSKSEIGIVCQNGADPTGSKVDKDMVIMSCGN